MTGPEAPPPLAPARVHEAEGPGRRFFALVQAVRHHGRIVWIMPAHVQERLLIWGMPPGFSDRLHVVCVQTEKDLLWATEEALRSGAAGMVIAEPEKRLSLTAGRRLQLAAEAGRTTGVLLVQENAGSNAAETRWHCAPLAATTFDSTRHHWQLKKNKKGTLGGWILCLDEAAHPVSVVPEAGE